MNIAYFLLPKSRIAYLYDDFTFRQGLEKMRNRGYTAIPVITRDGRYVGTVSEGDFLWRLLDTDDPSMKKAEELRVRDIIGSKYPAVRITVTMDALLESAMNQNFIPVIDDLDNFIGIVTRRENWAPMRENSTVIFLRRPLDQLPLDGRPVSQTTPLEELYAKRLPLYEQTADLTVDNDRVDRAADEIIRRLKL